MIYKQINFVYSGQFSVCIRDYQHSDRYADIDEHTFITILKHSNLESFPLGQMSTVIKISDPYAWLLGI